MRTTSKLRTAFLIVATLATIGFSARAADTDCSCEGSPVTESIKPDSGEDSAGRIGKRYVEAYANFTKRNHDALTSIAYGLDYNQPISANFDAGAFYSYSYFQDFRFAHFNTLGAAATYHQSYGKLKPYASVALAHLWSSLEDSAWATNARIGLEYAPLEKLVIQTGAGTGRILESESDDFFFGTASATCWLFPHAGLYTRLDWFEHGVFSGTYGIAARYAF